MMIDIRTIFDTIPQQFDRWRPRYCSELFADLIRYAKLDSGKSALEVGPGTGQATEPVLRTCCSYTAIELGENFTALMEKKFSSYPNFHIIHGDFETYDLGSNRFDLVFSAAAFQWIPEKIGYPKAFDLLRSGGAFAMFMTGPDIQPGGGYTDAPLYASIQEVYAQHFRPEAEYKCSLDYDARARYGFLDLELLTYRKTREYTADDYVSLIGTHSDHLSLKEPHKTRLYKGIREAIDRAGGTITLYDKITLYLARKP